MGLEILLSVGFFLLLLNFISLDISVSKMIKDNKSQIDVIAAIVALETAVKKLNAALRSHDRRLDRQLHEISDIKDRLDILESGHPDSEIDYGTVDDNGNITEVWFEGKRYVPEDKRDGDTVAFYADDRIVAETTKPDVKCCATCRHYRPGPDHTCTIRPWLHVTSNGATIAHSACNNYEKIADQYKDMGGNGKADELQIKIDYITLLQEQERITNKTRSFNKQLSSALESGIMSVREWKEFMEDLDSNA